jgi:hypothetical protein
MHRTSAQKSNQRRHRLIGTRKSDLSTESANTLLAENKRRPTTAVIARIIQRVGEISLIRIPRILPRRPPPTKRLPRNLAVFRETTLRGRRQGGGVLMQLTLGVGALTCRHRRVFAFARTVVSSRRRAESAKKGHGANCDNSSVNSKLHSTSPEIPEALAPSKRVKAELLAD